MPTRVRRRDLWEKFFADRGTHLAAMIAYFALLSFVPLTFLALSLLGLTGRADESSFLVREIKNTLPGTPIDRILGLVHSVQRNAATLGIVGGAALLWASLSLFSVLESAFNIVYGRPNPAWGLDQWLTSDGRTESRLLSSSFTRRFNNAFQASSTYTLALSMKDDTTGFGYQANNPFDPDADWATSSGFQRHTFRTNGIVRLPWEFSVSGSYFYGSGARFNPTSSTRPYSKPGTNRLNIGAPITIPAAVLDRWDGPAVIATGTTWTRNGLSGMPLHKVDTRVTKTVTLGNNMRVELLAEVFNVFNRKNYGAYNTTITSANFGQPVATSGNAYVPRQGQLGVRFSF